MASISVMISRGVISWMGRDPRVGRISASSVRQTCAAWFLVQPGAWRAYHSLATLRNVGLPRVSDFLRCLAARLAAEGSSSFRASNHFVRASAMPTFGNGPRLRVFSLPLTRYLPRQSLPPEGVTTR